MIGSVDEPESDYDLINVIIIRRGNSNGTERIFDYLQGIFLREFNRIGNYIDISKDKELQKEAESMSGLGQTIYDNAVHESVTSMLADFLTSGAITQEQAEQFAQKSAITKRDGLNMTGLGQTVYNNGKQEGRQEGKQEGVTGILDKFLAAGKITRDYADQLAEETLTEQNLPSED